MFDFQGSVCVVLCACGLFTNQYDREKDVTSINISAFAPGPVTCDFYTLVSFCSQFRQMLMQPGGRTAMETSTVSRPREESRGNNSASHSKLVVWPVPHSALAMELHIDIAYFNRNKPIKVLCTQFLHQVTINSSKAREMMFGDNGDFGTMVRRVDKPIDNRAGLRHES